MEENFSIAFYKVDEEDKKYWHNRLSKRLCLSRLMEPMTF